jgi:predicted ribosome quality control (RQC) complex YloA/Tae2 family protein
VGVFVSASGQLGTNPSSRRFKHDIADMDKQSETILALHPVSFHYKDELDPNQTAQYGLIAEEVAKVDPNLVARDDKGEIYSVRYEAVNAMLLDQFLKEHHQVEEQGHKQHDLEATIEQQQKDFQSAIEQQQEQIAALRAELKAQASQSQKANAGRGL